MSETKETWSERFIREVDTLIQLFKNRPTLAVIFSISIIFFGWHQFFKKKSDIDPIHSTKKIPTESLGKKMPLTDRFISIAANGNVEVFTQETTEIISFRLRSPKDWTPYLEFDVNQNRESDPYVDVTYGIMQSSTPCFQYYLDKNIKTTCGAFRSNAKLEVLRENDFWRSTIWHIPKSEVSSGGNTVWLNVGAYNAVTKEFSDATYAKPIQITLALQ